MYTYCVATIREHIIDKQPFSIGKLWGPITGPIQLRYHDGNPKHDWAVVGILTKEGNLWEFKPLGWETRNKVKISDASAIMAGKSAYLEFQYSGYDPPLQDLETGSTVSP